MMQLSGIRIVTLVLLDLVLFGIVTFLLLQWMSKPLKPIDYMLAGGAGTLVSLLGVWLLVWSETPNRSEMLFKRRSKKTDDTEAGA